MTIDLRDPDRPAGYVVEVREDGTALRNDGRELQPAAKNPWYVLMTIAGEQDGDRIDWDLHTRNRRYWNGWACSEMSEAARAELAEALELPVEALAPLTEDELRAVEGEFRRRLGPDIARPVPDDPVDLRKTHLSNTIVFERCVVAGDARFDSATFGGAAWFDSATFGGAARFGSATFGGAARFGSATFGGTAWFGSATFGGTAWFDSATFGGTARFGAATFGGDARFGSATFGGPALFASATFGGTVDFSNEGFAAQTDFGGARFKGGAPRFYQRRMHQDTSFTTRRENWPALTAENAAEAKQAYTRLRQIMSDLHKPDDEQFFGRQEMRCKAYLEGRFHGWVSRIYGFVSNYGHSVERPLAGLGLLIGLGWGLFGSGLRLAAGGGGAAEVWQGLGLSVANTFPYLGFHRRYFGGLPELHWALDLFGGVQTVLGGVLLFLLLLGLRNRFRLK